jgi:hypothetical protein
MTVLCMAIAILVWLALWLPPVQAAETETKTLVAYVDWFHRSVQASRSQTAKELIPTVITYAKKYNLDPLLVACLISFESSWRSRAGALNEIGYMQIMPGKWSEQFELTTQRGQIEAGAYRLRLAFIKCRSLEGALTHYACGRCVSKSERTKRKIQYRKKYYERMVKRFKNGK